MSCKKNEIYYINNYDGFTIELTGDLIQTLNLTADKITDVQIQILLENNVLQAKKKEQGVTVTDDLKLFYPFDEQTRSLIKPNIKYQYGILLWLENNTTPKIPVIVNPYLPTFTKPPIQEV